MRRPTPLPGRSDAVFAFVNLDRSNTQAGNYNVNITQNGSNLFGIDSTAFTTFATSRPTLGSIQINEMSGYGTAMRASKGSTILQNGVFVSLNPLPPNDQAWNTAPYETQYLKLYDISAPNTPAPSPQVINVYSYALGTSVTFNWSADPNTFPSYTVTVTVNAATFTVVTSATSYTYTGSFGDVVSITVKQPTRIPQPRAERAALRLLPCLILPPTPTVTE